MYILIRFLSNQYLVLLSANQGQVTSFDRFPPFLPVPLQAHSLQSPLLSKSFSQPFIVFPSFFRAVNLNSYYKSTKHNPNECHTKRSTPNEQRKIDCMWHKEKVGREERQRSKNIPTSFSKDLTFLLEEQN